MQLAELAIDHEGPQPLAEAANSMKQNDKKDKVNLRLRRNLHGHFGKVYALGWADNGTDIVSASQDGKLILWNAFTTHKYRAVAVETAWSMTCAYSPDGKVVASAGLDNICTVFRVDGSNTGLHPPVRARLQQHEAYIPCARFVNNEEMLTASGDMSCMLWNIETATAKTVFSGHDRDVMSVSVSEDGNTFVSGSCDASAKLWDLRQGDQCIQTFMGHESDINSVDFLSNGLSFGTGSDDSTCRVFDIRACTQMNKLASPKVVAGVTSVSFSKSGCTLFAGYDDYNVLGWATTGTEEFNTIEAHESRVSALSVSPTGKALATGSWDHTVRVWA